MITINFETVQELSNPRSTDLSSIMSGSIKLGTLDSRTSTFRPIPTSYSDTLELFPDPDSEVVLEFLLFTNPLLPIYFHL